DQIARGLWRYGWWGFECPVPDLFALWLKSDGGTRQHVVDVGANSGFYSLLAVHVRSDVVAHAFEPYPPVRRLLARNLRLNVRARGRVQVLPWAASNRIGTATLYVPDDDHGLIETSCSLDPASRVSFARTLGVETTTLDEYCATLPACAVSVVKIDA